MRKKLLARLCAVFVIAWLFSGTPASARTIPPPDHPLNHLAHYLSSGKRPPVVLVHGWQGLDFEADCDLATKLANNPDYANKYWLHLDEDLENLGFSLTYAHLKTGGATSGQPNCSPVAEENVPNLIKAIDEALAANPSQRKVILIAHSMGGLVSRAYLESAQYRDDVVELYTLGTPHLGVPINGIVSIVENLALLGGSDETINLATYCETQPIVCQFSDNEATLPGGFTGIETFNATFNTRRKGVHYHLVGGDVGFGDRGWFGTLMDTYINGPDDGIVPRSSALGIISASEKVGPMAGPFDRRESYELHSEVFTDSAGRLDTPQRRYTYFSQDEWQVDCGLLSCGEEYLGQALVSETNLECLEPVLGLRQPDHLCNGGAVIPLAAAANPRPEVDAFAPYTSGSLSVGQSASRTVWLEGGQAVLAARVEPGSTLELSLVAPDGTVIDTAAAGAAPDVLYKDEDDSVLFFLVDAQPGEWQMAWEVTAAPTGSTRYLTVYAYQSSIQASLQFDQPLYLPNESGVLTVNLAGNPTTATVTATIGSGPNPQTVQLARAGDVYTGRFAAPREAGYQPVTYSISGTTQAGLAFEQTSTSVIPVSSENFSLTGSYQDSVQTALNSAATASDLVVNVEIDAAAAGNVGVAADLTGRNGQVIATSSNFGPVDAGRSTLELRFRGDELRRAKRSGSYTVSNVRLVDYTAGGVTVDTEDEVHTTERYDVSSFAASDVELPHVAAAASADVTPHIVDSTHSCQVTASNNSGAKLATGNTFRLDCEINLINGDAYAEWLDYYYISGPTGWPMSNQSEAPVNVGGWNEPVLEAFSTKTGLAYWGVEYGDLADLDLDNSVLPLPGTFWGPWRPDTNNPHQFSITYAVPDAALPACPGSPFIGLPLDGQPVTAVAIGDLVDHSVNQVTYDLGGYICPLPAVALEVTVSTDGVCPGAAAVSIFEEPPEVTFCYELTNASPDVTVVDHSVVNSLIADRSLSLVLGPGESHSFSVETVVDKEQGQCYDNDVRWTATTEAGFGQHQGRDAEGPFIDTRYEAVGNAAATVCLGVEAPPGGTNIYLPLINK